MSDIASSGPTATFGRRMSWYDGGSLKGNVDGRLAFIVARLRGGLPSDYSENHGAVIRFLSHDAQEQSLLTALSDNLSDALARTSGNLRHGAGRRSCRHPTKGSSAMFCGIFSGGTSSARWRLRLLEMPSCQTLATIPAVANLPRSGATHTGCR